MLFQHYLSLKLAPQVRVSKMSVFKSVVKKDRTRRSQEARRPIPSYTSQVKKKLMGIPEYEKLSHDDCTELVKCLCSAEDLISYFDLSPDMGAATVEAETLPVQLVLKYLTAKPHGIQATLLEEYGPLHALVVIGGQILEWNWKSVVIPYGKPMPDGAAPPPEATAGDAFGIRDAELPCVKTELLKGKVLAEVAQFNKVCYYDVIHRNSHDFVISILRAMNLEKPTQLKSKLKEYFSALQDKKREFVRDEFETHDHLDQYVANNMEKFNDIEKEYLFFHYFIFHLTATVKQESPLKWECLEPDCKITFLEAYMNDRAMLLHKFKTVKYNFQQSTAL